MFSQLLAVVVCVLSFIPSLVLAHPITQSQSIFEQRMGVCTASRKKAAIQHIIDTVSSHSANDAALIPLASDVSRSFYVIPNELGVALPSVDVGTTAGTVRLQLVSLATVLNSVVPGNHALHIENADGSITSNFIQNDSIVLPHAHVSERYEFNDDCEITKISGIVQGELVCPGGRSPVGNPILIELCDALGYAWDL